MKKEKRKKNERLKEEKNEEGKEKEKNNILEIRLIPLSHYYY